MSCIVIHNTLLKALLVEKFPQRVNITLDTSLGNMELLGQVMLAYNASPNKP